MMIPREQVIYRQILDLAHICDSFDVHIDEIARYHVLAAQMNAPPRKDAKMTDAAWLRYTDAIGELHELILQYERDFGIGDPYHYAIDIGIPPDTTKFYGSYQVYWATVDYNNIDAGTIIRQERIPFVDHVVSPRTCLTCGSAFQLHEKDRWWMYRDYCSHYCAAGKMLAIEECGYCFGDINIDDGIWSW